MERKYEGERERERKKKSTGKEYVEDLYNIDIHKEVAVHMCGFDGTQRGNYFREELRLR